MISSHAAMARTFAEQLGLSGEVLDGIGASYEYWDGRGWPDGLKGEAIPLASRIVQLAEFVEVAHRVGGLEAREDARTAARRQAVRPGALHTAACGRGDAPCGSRLAPYVGRGDRRRAGARGDAVGRAVRRRTGGDRELRRPEVAVLPRPLAGRRRPRSATLRRTSGSRRRRHARSAAPGSCTTSDGWGSPTRSGTSAGRSAPASGSACGCTPT